VQVSASYTFDMPVAQVWQALMNPTVVCACLPGCRELRPIGDNRYEAELSVAVSAITGTFKGTVGIEDQIPPRSYKLVVEGSGGAGFVRGQSAVTLADKGTTTVVEVAGDVQIGGAMARVGQRLLAGVSKMMMDRFFECLREKAKSA
jgi:carbon monoxide dehydrogenase subunit G